MSRTLTSYHRYPPKQAEVAKLAKSSSTLMLPNLVRTLGLRDYLSFAFRWALCRVLCNDESMKSDSHPLCCTPQCGLPRDLLAEAKFAEVQFAAAPQYRLYFLPDPQWHSSFRPTLGALCRVSGMSRACEGFSVLPEIPPCARLFLPASPGDRLGERTSCASSCSWQSIMGITHPPFSASMSHSSTDQSTSDSSRNTSAR